MNTALETVQSRGVLAVPEHLREISGHEGLEAVTKEDLVLPRLSICQSTSDERKKTKDKYIEGLNDGDLFNSLTQQIYGNSVQVIPLSFSKSRIYFRPPVGSGVILCRSLNGIDGGTISPTCAACPNSEFAADGTPPVCTHFANFPVLVLPKMELMILSLKSTALPAAKKWVTRMQLLNKPTYAGVYNLRTVEQTMPKGVCFTPTIAFGTWTTAEQYKTAEKCAAELKGKTIAVEEAHEEESEVDDRNIPF